MKISPRYDQIKNRALELLNDPDGFNGHSPEEIGSWRGSRDRGLVLRNSVGLALCCARDEALEVNGFDWQACDKAVRFNKATSGGGGGDYADVPKAHIARRFDHRQRCLKIKSFCSSTRRSPCGDSGNVAGFHDSLIARLGSSHGRGVDRALPFTPKLAGARTQTNRRLNKKSPPGRSPRNPL